MFYRITMHRSAAALPLVYKETLRTLGLKKRGSVAYQKVSPAAAGMIAKVKELVKLELVEESKTKTQERQERKSKPGFSVMGSRL
ncbi:mitochondrial 54S ribosomal protein YmL33 [Saccharomycopsis crataegensis]|uniref:Large ribosomal subunit protein uL30m n=1 Tax=Saccharomycopsis crataegensis TaxID=43959 RepID=A0AAV5QPG5_9ASCO|nr:mitochondrial 54S ribosomal protein YmL33 [Saccharomycopsis crataegensis]